MISACAIGDIMLDVVTSLEFSDLAEVCDLKRVQSKIELLPGGTGTMFALAAVKEGFETTRLVGKVGADPKCEDYADITAQLVLNQLKQLKIDVNVALDHRNPTGVAMITYLSTGERLLVSESGANSSFSMADITPSMEESVTGSDILFVSGYSLLNETKAQAIFHLMQKARDCGRMVVLDVVPHSIYKVVDKPTFLRLTTPVNVIASEVNTMKHLFFHGTDRLPESSISVRTVADRLLNLYDAVILQPDFTYQFLIDKQGVIEEVATGSEKLPPIQHRGYADRITARLLLRHYTRLAEGLSCV